MNRKKYVFIFLFNFSTLFCSLLIKVSISCWFLYQAQELGTFYHKCFLHIASKQRDLHYSSVIDADEKCTLATARRSCATFNSAPVSLCSKRLGIARWISGCFAFIPFYGARARARSLSPLKAQNRDARHRVFLPDIKNIRKFRETIVAWKAQECPAGGPFLITVSRDWRKNTVISLNKRK